MHKCFISYKKEDTWYKNYLINTLGGENFINKSLDRTVNSDDGEYVLYVIRRDYLSDSTVTLFLIGDHSSENEGFDYFGDKNFFIKRELAASLYNGPGNSRSGIVGIVLPNMYDKVYKGSNICLTCGGSHETVMMNDATVIREFSYNYYTQPHDKCAWGDDDRYCILAKWDEFIDNPDHYINMAFDKRFSAISNKLRIYNLR